jgi:hypothetical protein
MTLGEMRKSLEESAGDGAEAEEEGDSSNTKSRIAPQNRGVGKSRSMVMEVDLPGLGGSHKKGTLTFANSVSELKRSGMSRRGEEFSRPTPQRAQSAQMLVVKKKRLM